MKKEKRFDILADRGKLIEEACREIIQRIEIAKKNHPSGSGVNVGNGNGSGRGLGGGCVSIHMPGLTSTQESNDL